MRIRMPQGYSELQFMVNIDVHQVVAFDCPFPALADQRLFIGWITPLRKAGYHTASKGGRPCLPP